MLPKVRSRETRRPGFLAVLMQDRSGGVTVIFGLVLLVLIGAVGFAVDYSRSQRIRTNAQTALDAAALAAARAVLTKTGDARTVAENYYQVNFAAKNDTTKFNIKTFANPAKKSIRLVATAQMKTAFARVLGFEKFDIKLTSQAVYGNPATEIALVLDNTGSMSGAKLDGLKSAAKSLVDAVYSAPGAADNVKVAIVPFAKYVNIGLDYRDESWIDVLPDSSTTTYSCWNTYPNKTSSNCQTVTKTCYNDGVPYSCTSTQCTWDYGAPVQVCGNTTTTKKWYGCVGSRSYPLDVKTGSGFGSRVPGIMNTSCTKKLTRLTNDKSDVLSTIDGMTAVGETFVQPGLIWGWRTLDWKAPFSDGFNPASTPEGKKYMVVMTDGANTKSPTYPDHAGSDKILSNKLAKESCANIKAEGVIVYTVAFGVSEADVEDVLTSCATSNAHYYTAADATALKDVFQDIAKSMTTVRIDR